VIRSVSGGSPIFEAMSFKSGDRLFFKEMSTYNYQLTGYLEMPSSGLTTVTPSAFNSAEICSSSCGSGGTGTGLNNGDYTFTPTCASGSGATCGTGVNIKLSFSTTGVTAVSTVIGSTDTPINTANLGSGYYVGNILTVTAAAINSAGVGTTTDFTYTLTESDLATPFTTTGNYVLCDYANSETCSCSNTGELSCSNAAHSCAGFSCVNTIPEGADTDCTDGTIAVSGNIEQVVPTANAADGTGLIGGSSFFDSGPSGLTVTHTVTLTNCMPPQHCSDTTTHNYAVDGASQPDLTGSAGNTYIFNLDSDTIDQHPLLFSTYEGVGSSGESTDAYTTGMVFTLDGKVRSLADYLMYFSSATTRSITYTPTGAVTLYYYSYTNEDLIRMFEETTDNPHSDRSRLVRTNIGGSFTVNRDDSGTFQLPADTPLTSKTSSTPRFLSACFIPAGAIESLHVQTGSSGPCDYTTPHQSTCTQSLINAQRIPDYLQVLPEPTQNLKVSHNESQVYNLQFNEPQYGTFWKSTNHWCSGSDTYTHPCGVRQSDRTITSGNHLCCHSDSHGPSFAAGSPDDIVVLKKEASQGSGDCTGVELIDDSDYFVGAEYTRKMTLTTIDDDRTTQTSPIRSDLTQGQLRAGSKKGAEASHHAIARGKVNELPPGYYTICYATAESGGDDNADYKKLSTSIEILPKTATGPYLRIPRTVLLGNNINVKWAASSGYQTTPSESHSWIGLYKVGDCPNDSGEFQNKCHLAVQTVNDGISGEGTITFSASDYKLTAGTYEVRYFDGTSRDNHGVICRGLPNVARDTYINCVIESVVTSSPIIVYADINQMDDLSAGVPGLEMVFDGSLGRYAGKGAGLPGSDNDGFQRPFNRV